MEQSHKRNSKENDMGQSAGFLVVLQQLRHIIQLQCKDTEFLMADKFLFFVNDTQKNTIFAPLSRSVYRVTM